MNDFDMVPRRDVHRLRAGLKQSRAPASIRPDNRLMTESPPDTPVAAGEHLHETLAPSLQRRLLEFVGRVLPIDLINDNEVGWAVTSRP